MNYSMLGMLSEKLMCSIFLSRCLGRYFSQGDATSLRLICKDGNYVRGLSFLFDISGVH